MSGHCVRPAATGLAYTGDHRGLRAVGGAAGLRSHGLQRALTLPSDVGPGSHGRMLRARCVGGCCSGTRERVEGGSAKASPRGDSSNCGASRRFLALVYALGGQGGPQKVDVRSLQNTDHPASPLLTAGPLPRIHGLWGYW